ncbi:MAG: Flp family type IVb pilin [Pseudomonadota bacterium]
MIIFFRRLIRNKRGATAVEYGLIVSLIVIACVGAMSQMADSTNGMWNNIAAAVSSN